MAKSRYEKNVIRRPAVIKPDGSEMIVDAIKTKGRADTGSITWFSQTLVENAQSIIELTIISGDIFVGRGTEWPPRTLIAGPEDKDPVVGRGVDWPAHKHDYEEMFLFQGTDPADPLDLGAEIEFWLGEDKELEKVEFKTSTCVHIPIGLAHFPLKVKNLKRPFVLITVMPRATQRTLIPASLAGRPIRRS
ncbi:MAG: hypothetical protein A2Z29_06295 [Chloroflexi bacterium RBG_16_56_11]|nr:MAG: hypothetical protein A2Z29_06295 [Chloroflexi bacterium RBG_16_56_11]